MLSTIRKFVLNAVFQNQSLRRRFAYYIAAIVVVVVSIQAAVFFVFLRSALFQSLENKGRDFVSALASSAQVHIDTGDPFDELPEVRNKFTEYSDVAYIIFEKRNLDDGSFSVLDETNNASKSFADPEFLKQVRQWAETKSQGKNGKAQTYTGRTRWNKSGQTLKVYHFAFPTRGRSQNAGDASHPDSSTLSTPEDTATTTPDSLTQSGTAIPAADALVISGIVHIGIQEKPVQDAVWSALVWIVIVGVFATMLGFLIADFVARQVSRPIIAVAQAMKRAQGGDLSCHIDDIEAKDEAAVLITSFNEMLSEIRSTFKTVLQNADEVAATSEQLSAAAEQITASAQELAATVHEIAKGATKQSDDITRILNNSEQVATAADSVAISAQLAEQTSRNADLSAKTGQESATRALTSISSISQVTEETASVVNALGEKSKQINTIVEVIADISRQTNLLSLNAAIEAARAGEYGRGFSVVADEVRKLAGQTDSSLKEISSLVKEIQSSTQRAVSQTRSVEHAVSEGQSTIRESTQSLQQIIREIASASQTVQSITTAAESQQEQVKNLISRIESVAAIAESNASNAEEVAATVEEQRSSMEQMAYSSLQLADVAEKLHVLIKKFKLQ